MATEETEKKKKKNNQHRIKWRNLDFGFTLIEILSLVLPSGPVYVPRSWASLCLLHQRIR